MILSPDLSVTEIENAEKSLHSLIQKVSFKGLTDNSILSLRSVEDKDGILREKTNVIYLKDTENFSAIFRSVTHSFLP